MLPRRPISPAYRDPDTSRQRRGPLTGGMTDPERTRNDLADPHDPCCRLAGRRRGRRCRRVPGGALSSVAAAPARALLPRPAGGLDRRIADRARPDWATGCARRARRSPPRGSTIPRDEHAARWARPTVSSPTASTVFDSGYPAVSRLDPALLRALRKSCHRRRGRRGRSSSSTAAGAPGVPGAAVPSGSLGVRLSREGRPMGGDAGQIHP